MSEVLKQAILEPTETQTLRLQLARRDYELNLAPHGHMDAEYRFYRLTHDIAEASLRMIEGKVAFSMAAWILSSVSASARIFSFPPGASVFSKRSDKFLPCHDPDQDAIACFPVTAAFQHVLSCFSNPGHGFCRQPLSFRIRTEGRIAGKPREPERKRQ